MVLFSRTSGLSSSAVSKRKPAYDPARQWGLKPEADAEGAGASYVVSGHIVKGSGSSADTDSLYIAENMGREGQAKAHRKKAVDEDKSLKALLDRDKEGMKAVIKAREVAEQEELRRKASGKAKGKQDKIEGGSGSRKGKEKATEEESASEETESPSQAPLKNAYSAQLIKQLGFDPVAAKIGSQRKGDSEMQKKVCGMMSGMFVLNSHKLFYSWRPLLPCNQPGKTSSLGQDLAERFGQVSRSPRISPSLPKQASQSPSRAQRLSRTAWLIWTIRLTLDVPSFDWNIYGLDGDGETFGRYSGPTEYGL